MKNEFKSEIKIKKRIVAKKNFINPMRKNLLKLTNLNSKI